VLVSTRSCLLCSALPRHLKQQPLKSWNSSKNASFADWEVAGAEVLPSTTPNCALLPQTLGWCRQRLLGGTWSTHPAAARSGVVHEAHPSLLPGRE